MRGSGNIQESPQLADTSLSPQSSGVLPTAYNAWVVVSAGLVMATVNSRHIHTRETCIPKVRNTMNQCPSHGGQRCIASAYADTSHTCRASGREFHRVSICLLMFLNRWRNLSWQPKAQLSSTPARPAPMSRPTKVSTGHVSVSLHRFAPPSPQQAMRLEG